MTYPNPEGQPDQISFGNENSVRFCRLLEPIDLDPIRRLIKEPKTLVAIAALAVTGTVAAFGYTGADRLIQEANKDHAAGLIKAEVRRGIGLIAGAASIQLRNHRSDFVVERLDHGHGTVEISGGEVDPDGRSNQFLIITDQYTGDGNIDPQDVSLASVSESRKAGAGRISYTTSTSLAQPSSLDSVYQTGHIDTWSMVVYRQGESEQVAVSGGVPSADPDNVQAIIGDFRQDLDALFAPVAA